MILGNNAMFVRGPSPTVRFVVLGIASLLIMVLDHRMHHLEQVRSTLSIVVYPLQILADIPVSGWEWASENFAERNALLAENAKLHEQQLLTGARLQKLAALESENMRLRVLLESAQKVPERVLIGELLSIDFDPYKHQVLINKGSVNAIFIGQPLLDAHGVMGQVIHVSPASATAMLLTDPNHAIPVQLNRTGIRTVAVGTGDLRRLELPYLPNNIDVRVGDLLVTSGLGGRFPPAYPVATVNSVEPDPSGSFARITATPFAELDRAREVLLVWSGLSSDELEAEAESETPSAATSETPKTPANTSTQPDSASAVSPALPTVPPSPPATLKPSAASSAGDSEAGT